jgi:hypothetical protein
MTDFNSHITKLFNRIANFLLPDFNIKSDSIAYGNSTRTIALVKLFLKIGVFGTFLGHGINAILVKASWIHLITTFGFSNEFAIQIMPAIGILDVLIAISILIYPIRIVLIWAIFWAFITALSRPISGEPYIEFIERAANWVAPLALLLLSKKRSNI